MKIIILRTVLEKLKKSGYGEISVDMLIDILKKIKGRSAIDEFEISDIEKYLKR